MNIIQLTQSLHAGGIETLVKDYALHFGDECNCAVICISKTDVPSTNELQLKEKDKKVLYLTDISPLQQNYIKKLFHLIHRRRWFFQYIHDNNIDVVHAHMGLTRYLIFLPKSLNQVKLFHTVHNEPSKIFGTRKGAKLEKICTKHLIKKYGMRLIALHEEMRVELNEMFGVDNTVVLNNGINLERFQPDLYQENKINFKTSLGFHEDDYIIGNIGRLVDVKNHAFLLDIFAKLCQKKENAKLLLVGSGPLKDALIQQMESLQIRDRVIMLENRKDIPELLSVMDVFVFPSIYEGLPVTLVEAQAMGLKCVVSDKVTSGIHATEQYIPMSLDDSADKWCEVILDDRLRTTPKVSLSDFDMKEVVKKLEKIYLGEI